MIFLRIKPADQPHQWRTKVNPQFGAQAFSCITVWLESGQIKAIGHNDHSFSSIAAPYMNLPRVLGTREN
jgi:hypothetical protein